jgi:hypothetical protein
MSGISCQEKECADNLESVIRRLRAAEERVKHYRLAALKLADGDAAKLKEALYKTYDEL